MNRLSSKVAIVLALFLLTSLGLAQNEQRLSAYLAVHPWDSVHSGPMLVIDPDGAKVMGKGDSLEAFGRVRKTVGGLNAIVPSQMVSIDDSFRQPPNMYDGLDRSAKVMYLLSTLEEGQWRTALSNGIGLGDLNSNQQKVFLSLLPSTFAWRSYEAGKPHLDTDSGILSDQDREQVRLYIGRHLGLAVHAAGSSNSYSFINTDLYGIQPGQTVSERKEASAGDDIFGVHIRNLVPHDSKPSDLTYTQFTKLIKVPAKSTVGDVLTAIGASGGLEIHADFRVAGLPVWFYGERAQMGDVLKAIALAVSGTYRRIGSTYELTSDLVGMGTRKLRFALWQNDVLDAQAKMNGEWQSKVGAKGEIFKAKFDPNDPLAPTDSIFTPEDDNALSPQRMIPDAQLTPGIRSVLQAAGQANPNRYDLSGAMLISDYRYGFVLPNGKKLRYEGGLGRTPMFKNLPRLPFRGPGRPVPNDLPPLDRLKGRLAAAPKSAGDAKSLADLALHKGLAELWIETSDPAILSAAAEETMGHPIAIRLMVHPWSFGSPGSVPDQDRTILGEASKEVAVRRDESISWSLQHQTASWLGAWEQPQMSPADSGRASLWANIVEMSQRKGLAGTVLVNQSPTGYEGARINRGRLSSALMGESVDFGYSTVQRLAFLRANGIDPIDISSGRVPARPDLRQPFFPDDSLRGQSTEDDNHPEIESALLAIQGKWDHYRGDSCSQAIRELAEALGAKGVPVLIERRNPGIDASAEQRIISPWVLGQDLPVASTAQSEHEQDVTVFYDMGAAFRMAPLLDTTVNWVIDVGQASPAEAKEALDHVYPEKTGS